MLYYIVFVILIIALIAINSDKKVNNVLYLGAVAVLILYSGLRNAFIYPDINNYYDFFEGQESFSLENFGTGYTILNDICRWITPSFQFLLIVIALFVVYCYTHIIKRYSPYIWLSLLIYIFINYYPSFFLLRQYISMAVFLYSIKYVINRKPIHYGILLLVAMSFHVTAIVTLPFYFLYGIKKSTRNMLFLLAGSVIVVISFMSLEGYVEMASAYYAHYFSSLNEEPAWQRAVMKLYIFVLFLLGMRWHFYEEGINRVVFYFMLFNVIICIAAMNVSIVYRVREYFSLADFVGVPILIKTVSSYKGGRRAVMICLIVVYIALLAISFSNFVNGDNMNNAYQFYWLSK